MIREHLAEMLGHGNQRPRIRYSEGEKNYLASPSVMIGVRGRYGKRIIEHGGRFVKRYPMLQEIRNCLRSIPLV